MPAQAGTPPEGGLHALKKRPDPDTPSLWDEESRGLIGASSSPFLCQGSEIAALLPNPGGFWTLDDPF